MDKEKLRDMYKETWKWVGETIPHDLSDLNPPFLEINTVREGFENFRKSLDEKDPFIIDEVEVPTDMVKIFHGTLVDFNFYYGGILIPVSCLEDPDEQILGGLVHEQVHNVLKSKAFIYGLSDTFQGFPDVNYIISNFVEFLAHIYSARTLEKNGFKNNYYEVPVIYTRRALSKLNKKPEREFDEEVRLITQQHEDFWKEIKDFDPIDQRDDCFVNFLRDYAKAETIKRCVGVYESLARTSKIIKRREIEGNWKTIYPVL
jgi:hypothetical protein